MEENFRVMQYIHPVAAQIQQHNEPRNFFPYDYHQIIWESVRTRVTRKALVSFISFLEQNLEWKKVPKNYSYFDMSLIFISF
jgi:hypothetical protein